MKKILATAAILTFVAAASATITARFDTWTEPGVLGGDGGHAGEAYTSYRIYVTLSDTPPDEPHGWVPGPDDWTAAGLQLSVTGGTFYDHDTLDADPPNPLFFTPPFEFFDSEFTSYYTSPGDYPNTAYDGGIVGFAGPVLDDETTRDADWFDTLTIENPPGESVEFVVAQFTTLGSDLEGFMDYAARNSGGTLFRLVIPEPGTLALLALGGLALIRRR